MEINRTYYLYNRYLSNKLTAAELKELQLVLDDPTQEEILKSLFDKTWDDLKKDETHYISQSKDVEIYQHIISQKRHKTAWLSIAATIFLCLCGMGLFYKLSKNTPLLVSLQTGELTDITPRADKPTLILADGKKIALNTDKEGIIVQDKEYIYEDGTTILNKSSDITTNHPSSSKLNTIITPIGSQYMVIIPDGSKVWLNSASILKFPEEFGDNREVYLSGEAYFEIKKNKEKPFFVRTDKQEIAVLGTQFNVSAYNGDVHAATTLLKGAVNVKSMPPEGKNSNFEKGMLLQPGQQVVTDNQYKSKLETNADTIQAMAWKEGLFVFNNESIEDIMKSLARWYPIDVKYQGDLKNVRFVGNYSRAKGLLNLLENIETTGKVHFKIEQSDDISKERRILIVAN